MIMDKSRMKSASTSKLPGFPAATAWERAWQKHWSKVGMPGYELPVGGRDGEDRDFLTHARTPEKERTRLKRINDEFIRGFKGMFDVGPAVTVFGSARFKPSHPYYKLARATGAELAKTGFATLTGGGPGIMEAANRGAYEAGGASYGLRFENGSFGPCVFPKSTDWRTASLKHRVQPCGNRGLGLGNCCKARLFRTMHSSIGSRRRWSRQSEPRNDKTEFELFMITLDAFLV